MAELLCKNCNEELEAGWDQCPSCLTAVETNHTCSDCGNELRDNWTICPYCKTSTTGKGTNAGNFTGSGSNATPFMSVSGKDQQQVKQAMELPEFPPDTEVGEKYIIKEKLGQGGSGRVYKATHKILGEDIALKTIGSFQSVDNMLNDYLGEYKSQRNIQNRSHVLHVEAPEKFQWSGLEWIFLPMELADLSLREWLGEYRKNKEERVEKGLELFKQICTGIKAIHDVGLAHLDLKPENVLLTKQNDSYTVKIADFGLARSLSSDDIVNPAIYKDGVGTPWYMAPEQVLAARSKDVGPAADIYSLGIILFELVDGAIPFDGSPDIVRKKHREMEPPKLEPKWVNNVIQKCLIKDQDARLQDVDKIVELISKDPEEEADFKEAKKKDTIEAWETFLVKWPERIREAEASERLHFLKKEKEWNETRKSLLEKFKTAIDTENFEEAEKLKGKLESHLKEKINEDNEYLNLREYYVTEKQKYEKAWKKRRKELIENTAEFLKNKNIEQAERTLNALKSHLGSMADNDEEFLNLSSRFDKESEEATKYNRMRGLLDQAATYLNQADFERAKSKLENIENKFTDHSDVQALQEKLKTARNTYPKLVDNAKKLKSSGDLIKAKKEVQKALSYCKNATNAQSLLNYINNAMDAAENAVIEAKTKIDKAAFSQASSLLMKAKEKWPEYSEIEKVQQSNESTKEAYEKAKARVNSQIKSNNFDEAYAACEKMSSICYLEDETYSLKRRIDQAKIEYEKKKEKRIELFKTIAKWFGILAAVGVGIYIAFYGAIYAWEWITSTVHPWIVDNPFKLLLMIGIQSIVISIILLFIDDNPEFIATIILILITSGVLFGITGCILYFILEISGPISVAYGLLSGVIAPWIWPVGFLVMFD